MDFTLTDAQEAIKSMASDFSMKELAPYAGQWDQKAFFPLDTLRQAATLGLSGLYVDPHIGGSGVSRLDGVLVFESLSQGCISTSAYISIHNMVAWIIDVFGNDTQRKKFLPHLLTMDKLSSYCLTEPGAGSDAASLSTKAVLDGDSYILTGEKCFISGGGVSDYYLCMVRTGDATANGISCLLVEKGTKGLSFGSPEKKMGWRAQPTTTVTFDGCRVPRENLIGVEGDGFKIAMQALDGGRLNIAACSLGGAARALKISKEYMTDRQQFGKPLKDFQALQFRYADLVVKLEASKLMVYKAASLLDISDASARHFCAMAKKFATDSGFQIANEALQFLGGYGYIQDYEIERIVRDLRVHQILEGTNEIMQLIIARHALGEN